MKNPTLVIITDRNDLDGQLFSQFSAAKDLMSPPSQASSRDHLKELLQVAGGGVVSTIQNSVFRKVRNIPSSIVITLSSSLMKLTEVNMNSLKSLQRFKDGLPYASYIGFTGTLLKMMTKIHLQFLVII